MARHSKSTKQTPKRAIRYQEALRDYCLLLICSLCSGTAYYAACIVIIWVFLAQLILLVTKTPWTFGSVQAKWWTVAAFILVLPLRYLYRYVDRKFGDAKTQLKKQ